MLPWAGIGTHIQHHGGLAFQAALMPPSEMVAAFTPALAPHPHPESQEIFSMGYSTSQVPSPAAQCLAFLTPNPKYFGAISCTHAARLDP